MVLPHQDRRSSPSGPTRLVGTGTEAKGHSIPVSEIWLDCKEVAGERCLALVGTDGIDRRSVKGRSENIRAAWHQPRGGKESQFDAETPSILCPACRFEA